MYEQFTHSKTVKDGSGNLIVYLRKEFVCDTADDLDDIDVSNLMMGSMAYVISDKKLYIMDSTGTWTATE